MSAPYPGSSQKKAPIIHATRFYRHFPDPAGDLLWRLDRSHRQGDWNRDRPDKPADVPVPVFDAGVDRGGCRGAAVPVPADQRKMDPCHSYRLWLRGHGVLVHLHPPAATWSGNSTSANVGHFCDDPVPLFAWRTHRHLSVERGGYRHAGHCPVDQPVQQRLFGQCHIRPYGGSGRGRAINFPASSRQGRPPVQRGGLV